MPKEIYESLNLWGLAEGGEGISLTNNAIIFLIGVAEGVFAKNPRENGIYRLSHY
jgi:hypothetical protein